MTYVKKFEKGNGKMKQDLVATFTNGLGKTHDWKYSNLKNDLPIPVIKEACELLTTLDIFEEDGVKLFDSVVTAKIVTTYETEIFDLEKEPKEEKVASSQKKEKAPEMSAVKTENNYDYLFNTSRTVIAKSLEGSAEAKSVLPSLIIPVPQIGTKTIPSIETNSVSKTSPTLATHAEVPKQHARQKGFFAWLRQRKNRNKDDPDICSRDGDSSS